MPRDVERFWRTTQNLRRFEYGPRPATLARVGDQGYLTENQAITVTGDVTGTGTTSLVLELTDTGVLPGSYTNTDLTVDVDGRITAASNGSGGTGGGATTLTGDVTGSGTGTVGTTIAPGVVGYSKQQNVAAARLIGNPTGSAAVHSEISLGTGLSFAGTVLNGAAGTLTGITAGTGITVSGASPSLTVGLAVPVTVANGGTNATALPVNAAGIYGLTGTFLATTGASAVPVSNAFATFGTAGTSYLYNASLGMEAGLTLSRANGTFASPTALLSGHTIGALAFDGTYAGAWNAASRATIIAAATENWTALANGTSLEFRTTLLGTLTTALRMTVQAGVLVGAPSGGDKGTGTVNAATGLFVNNVSVLTGNQTITLAGDVTGSGATAIAATLANTAVTPAAYTHTALTVDSKGRVTAAANGTFTGDATLSGNALTLNTVTVAKGGTGLTAGVSGGIPFYSGTAAMTSSGLLGAGQVVVGGGAGTTPATIANGQLPATATNDNATAGKVGEYLSAITLIASEVTVSNTNANVATLSLTAGDWNVSGEVWLDTATGGAATVNGRTIAAITTTSAGVPSVPADNTAANAYSGVPLVSFGAALILPVGPVRISLASTTNVFLTCNCSTSAGTAHAYGKLMGRRVR